MLLASREALRADGVTQNTQDQRRLRRPLHPLVMWLARLRGLSAMVTAVFWVLGIINGLIWLFNGCVAVSGDKSGSGMVLMATIPLGLLVGLVSLVIVGFLT